MSVSDSHWSEFLKPDEEKELDRIQLAILKNKDDLAELRRRERKMLELGTSRKRRAAKCS